MMKPLPALISPTRDQGDQIQRIRGELNQVKEAITKPQFCLCQENPIPSGSHWVKCGTSKSRPGGGDPSVAGHMGSAIFLRVAEIVTPMRKCKKCFEMGNDSFV